MDNNWTDLYHLILQLNLHLLIHVSSLYVAERGGTFCMIYVWYVGGDDTYIQYYFLNVTTRGLCNSLFNIYDFYQQKHDN
jgi:hypothetical protein